MGLTIADQSLHEVVNALVKNYQWFHVLNEYADKMNAGFYDQDFLDCVVQKWHDKYDIYDAYVFAHIHVYQYTNELVYCVLPVGHEPKADANIEGNNNILKSLPLPFYGEFWGGTQDQDGIFGWNEWDDAIFKPEPEHNKLFYGNQRFSLEVGYQRAGKTLMQLMSERRLARWAYGSKFIWCFWFTGKNPIERKEEWKEMGRDIIASLPPLRNKHKQLSLF